MSEKDYYVILGISPGESQAGVKNAFRDLAMRYHPDRAGPRETRRFQEISEAYSTLGDRRRRAVYDDSLRESRDTPAEPVRRASQPPAESFDAEPAATRTRGATRPARERLSLLEDFLGLGGAAHELLDRLGRNFLGGGLPKSGRSQGLSLGIHMSPEEALRGADVRIGVPVLLTCSHCHGLGRIGLYGCARCLSTGTLPGEEDVVLRIPANVHDGALFRIALGSLGIRNLYLTVVIRIEA